jgi:hypothetical protein
MSLSVGTLIGANLVEEQLQCDHKLGSGSGTVMRFVELWMIGNNTYLPHPENQRL